MFWIFRPASRTGACGPRPRRRCARWRRRTPPATRPGGPSPSRRRGRGTRSGSRAAAVREVLAAAPDMLVVEDDHAGELSVEPLHALAGATGSWAFLRSVSKPYGPDLRVALLAGDETTVARVQGRQRVGTGWVST